MRCKDGAFLAVMGPLLQAEYEGLARSFLESRERLEAEYAKRCGPLFEVGEWEAQGGGTPRECEGV